MRQRKSEAWAVSKLRNYHSLLASVSAVVISRTEGGREWKSTAAFVFVVSVRSVLAEFLIALQTDTLALPPTSHCPLHLRIIYCHLILPTFHRGFTVQAGVTKVRAVRYIWKGLRSVFCVQFLLSWLRFSVSWERNIVAVNFLLSTFSFFGNFEATLRPNTCLSL